MHVKFGRQLGQLPMRLEVQSLPNFSESARHSPVPYEPPDDLLRLRTEVGAKESPRVEPISRIADQDPT
jgi:hypothetical protein